MIKFFHFVDFIFVLLIRFYILLQHSFRYWYLFITSIISITFHFIHFMLLSLNRTQDVYVAISTFCFILFQAFIRNSGKFKIAYPRKSPKIKYCMKILYEFCILSLIIYGHIKSQIGIEICITYLPTYPPPFPIMDSKPKDLT